MKTKIALALLCAALAGCEDPEDTSDASSGGPSETSESAETTQTAGTTQPTETTESGETGEEVGTFEIGFGEEDFTPLEDGGELHVVWGSQGAAMFPMPIRGSGFSLAPDPKDYTDPRTPQLDLELDVDGMDAGVCGNFKCIRNYPIAFDILPDETYEFVYVRVIMPDDVDPTTLDGRSAHLEVSLTPHDSAPLLEVFDLTVRVDPPPI